MSGAVECGGDSDEEPTPEVSGVSDNLFWV